MRIALLVLATLLVVGARTAPAHVVEGSIPLTVAEANPAVPPPSDAGGTATLEVNNDLAIEYEVTVQHLTGAAVAAHLHRAPAGQQNPIPEIPLTKVDDVTFRGETDPLTPDQLATLLSGGFYVNVHTQQNPLGEVRGQVVGLEIVHGTCSCRDLSRKDFLKCVRGQIRSLSKDERKAADVKALKKAIVKSSCGLAKAPKKKPLACCLPINEAAKSAVSGKLCAPVKTEAQCTKLGGSLGSGSCLPANPCLPPASPSAAFLD
jgi:hypothetical protein